MFSGDRHSAVAWQPAEIKPECACAQRSESDARKNDLPNDV